MRASRAAGFTLVEILMVLVIASILAMIAIPYYQDYRTRAKVAGGFGLIEPVKKRVTEAFMVSGAWPVDNDDALVAAPASYHGDYLQQVEVGTPQPGALTLTYDSDSLPALGGNNTIVFYPEVHALGGTVQWRCDQGSMAQHYRPPQCR